MWAHVPTDGGKGPLARVRTLWRGVGEPLPCSEGLSASAAKYTANRRGRAMHEVHVLVIKALRPGKLLMMRLQLGGECRRARRVRACKQP